MKKLMLLLLLLLSPLTAWAHAGHAAATGFLNGVAHPFSGPDHLLAMIAVGLWAAQTGGRALWALPLTFVGLMLAGGLAGMSGLPLPVAEQGIVASLLVLGLLIAAARHLPIAAGMAVVGVFAGFHGAAHGIEMPAGSPALYMAGFAVSTALLHATGIAAGMLGKGLWVRSAGALVGVSGLYLMLA